MSYLSGKLHQVHDTYWRTCKTQAEEPLSALKGSLPILRTALAIPYLINSRFQWGHSIAHKGLANEGQPQNKEEILSSLEEPGWPYGRQ